MATDGSQRFAVVPTPGREKVSFVTRVVRGHLEVVPVDALPLVNTGKLDRRLFDVTALLSYGYDDRRGDLPLIVASSGSGAAATVRTRAIGSGVTVTRELPAVRGFAVKATRQHATAYWNSLTTVVGGGRRALRAEVARVWLDAKRQPTLDVSVPQIGAPQAWAAGYTGDSVAVGVVDTGIDDTHPDLAGKVLAAQDFTGSGDTLDRVGHGTHVASTITGSGAASGGRYKGVAPGSRLYSAKVCLVDGCDESWIIAGMQWVAEVQHAKVVNMSLGGYNTPAVDPLEQAVQTLTAQYGTLFVVSAGNDGADGAVSSPSTADEALSVGAVSKTEELADFSSRGPRAGDFGIKPEITAPGVDIVAARSKDSQIGVPTGPDNQYLYLSGTSMAAPHVAGAAAILAQQHPDWTSGQLKATLMASAKPNPAIGVYAQGAGRVDVARAITQQVSTSPTSVSFGMQQWPHTDDAPIAKTVTYHNTGAAAVTLDLAFHTTGPDGKPTATGLFTVSPATVTVPAGGDASVTVTADTRAGNTDGYLGGQLTATAAGVAVQTPVAVIREVESYDLTTTVIDRAGNPTGEYESWLYGLDEFSFHAPWDASGTVTTRLPKGRYDLNTTIYEWNGRGYNLVLLVQPLITLDRAQSVTLDGRTAKPISVTVPNPDAKLAYGGVTYRHQGNGYAVGSGLLTYTFNGVFTAQVGPTAPVAGFTSLVNGHWARELPVRDNSNTPYQYLLAWPSKGSYPTGFERSVNQRDLATVQKEISVEAAGARGVTAAYPRYRDLALNWAVNMPYDLPGTHTEYYNTESGIEWASVFTQQAPGMGTISENDGPYLDYRRGHTYRESWNRGVFGPVFPARARPEQWVTRSGDTLTVGVPVYGDGDGRAGYSLTDTASVTVYKDGANIANSAQLGGEFPVPPEAGQYRVVQEATRGAPFALSTRVSTEWTFRSGHVGGTAPRALPLSAIRFSPALDPANKAPAGPLFVLPITVQHQPGSAAATTRSLRLQVSYDDGETWTDALVLGLGDNRAALLHHRTGGGFVSLKAAATDEAGNTVEQTIIRAYKF